VRLVIGDDHTLLLDALAAALTARGWDVAATVTSPDAAVAAVVDHAPDVCLLDVSFPGASGLDAAQKIIELVPSTHVVLFTASDDADTVLRAVEIGVHGFMRKDQGIERIVGMLGRVLAGETVIEGDLLRNAVRAQGVRGRREQQSPLRFLTARERQVLEHLCAGETTAEIAASLHVANSTARTHVQSVLTKLGVHSRLQAVALLLRDRDAVG
jgi:DNA-binding NarL/FixJ family response regulator